MNSIIFGKWFYITYNTAMIFILHINQHIIWAMIFLLCIAIFLIISSYIAHKYIFIDINKILNINNEDYGGIDNNNESKTNTPQWLIKSKSIKPLIYLFITFKYWYCIML